MARNQVCFRCVHWLKRSLQTWACAPMAGGFLCSWANEAAGSWGKGPFPTPDLSVPLWMSPAGTNMDTQGSWSKDGKREGVWGALLLNWLMVSPYSALWNHALRTQTMRQPQPCMEPTPPVLSSLQCPPSSLSPRLLPARICNYFTHFSHLFLQAGECSRLARTGCLYSVHALQGKMGIAKAASSVLSGTSPKSMSAITFNTILEAVGVFNACSEHLI